MHALGPFRADITAKRTFSTKVLGINQDVLFDYGMLMSVVQHGVFKEIVEDIFGADGAHDHKNFPCDLVRDRKLLKIDLKLNDRESLQSLKHKPHREHALPEPLTFSSSAYILEKSNKEKMHKTHSYNGKEKCEVSSLCSLEIQANHSKDQHEWIFGAHLARSFRTEMHYNDGTFWIGFERI